MKKIALILSLVLMLAACGAQPAETTAPAAATAPEGTCADLMTKLYENVPVELALMTETMETSLSDAEMFTYLTGLQSNEGVADVAVSLPMMGAQAYHVVMVRAESAEKAAELAQYLFDNADMARWVCVQATEKQAVVCGDLAFFVMLDPQYGVTCDQLVEGFTTVCGGTVDSVIK
ncbi:MAG: hypothetical protein IJA84_04995 [Clostridia bacterium]|nr:hypothetical protein [Clostridia bacterium]